MIFSHTTSSLSENVTFSGLLICSKINLWFYVIVAGYTQHSVLPQMPVGQLSAICQRAVCRHVDLKSQMRSNLGNNGEWSWSTRRATFLHRQWRPRKSWILVRWGRENSPERKNLERKEATPPSCHASAHHTSHKLHTPFHLECRGPKGAEWYRWRIPSCLLAGSSHAWPPHPPQKLYQLREEEN